MPEDRKDEQDQTDRRKFIQGASCAIGAAVGLVPTGAAVRVVLAPIGRQREESGGGFVKLTHVDDQPPGVPVKFTIMADKTDKWSRYTDVPIGAVHLLREGLGEQETEDDACEEASGTPEETEPPPAPEMKAAPKVTAFSTICPHLGCFVDYRSAEKDFYCPCHNSKFDLSGKALNKTPPRPMDELDIDQDKLRATGEVWVNYVRFKTNTDQKIPLTPASGA